MATEIKTFAAGMTESICHRWCSQCGNPSLTGKLWRWKGARPIYPLPLYVSASGTTLNCLSLPLSACHCLYLLVTAPICLSLPLSASHCPYLTLSLPTAPICLSLPLSACHCPYLPVTAPICLSLPLYACHCPYLPVTAPICCPCKWSSSVTNISHVNAAG